MFEDIQVVETIEDMNMDHALINDDARADELLEEIKDLEVEYNRYKIMADTRIETIQQKLQVKKEQMEKETEFLKAQLRSYFNTVKLKETKTQKSYGLLSGKLVLKKEKDQIVKEDEEELLTWAEKNVPDLIKVKKDVNWAELKKQVKECKDFVINIETGEIQNNIKMIEDETGIFFIDNMTGEVIEDSDKLKYFESAVIYNNIVVDGLAVEKKPEEFQVKID